MEIWQDSKSRNQENLNTQRLNRIKTAASHTGLVLTVLGESNRSGLCKSLLRRKKGHSWDDWCQRRSQPTGHNLSLSVPQELVYIGVHLKLIQRSWLCGHRPPRRPEKMGVELGL